MNKPEQSIAEQREAGFALVELMLVVMIIGVLTSSTAPQLRNLKRSYALIGAAKAVWIDLQRARVLAIKENTTIRVDFTSTSYTIVRVAAGTVVFGRNLAPIILALPLGSLGTVCRLEAQGLSHPQVKRFKYKACPAIRFLLCCQRAG
jgi:prepilin-type N-terminal cleavage/methylation domain-containing protein